jgi:glutaredoxin 3
MPAITRTASVLIIALFLAGCAAPVVKDLPQQQSPVNTIARTGPKIVLYSTSWCPHCREAKAYFKKNNIAYTNRDVEEDEDAMTALVETYNSKAVPVIVFGNDEKVLKGFKQEEFEKAYEGFGQGK